MAYTKSTSNFGFSEAETAELKDAFALLDVERQGLISSQEMVQLLHEVHHDILSSSSKGPFRNMQAKSLDKLLENLSKLSPDKNLSYEDFSLIVRRDASDERGELQMTFDLFDVEGKGFINLDDLRRIANDLGEVMMEDDLKEMIDRTSSEEGKVRFSDFSVMMMKKLFSP